MKRPLIAVLAATASLVAAGGSAAAVGVLDPESVDANVDVAFYVYPGATETVNDITVSLPAGFRVWGCPSFNFTCHEYNSDPSQPTTLHWTRTPGTEGQPASGGRVEFDAHTPTVPGAYQVTIAVNDSASGSRQYDPVVQVKGTAATTTSTTSTTVPTSATTTSTSSTTTTSSTTSSTVVATTTTTQTAVTSASSDDSGDDTNTAMPLAVGIVALGATSVGAASYFRRARRLAS